MRHFVVRARRSVSDCGVGGGLVVVGVVEDVMEVEVVVGGAEEEVRSFVA